MTKKKSFVVITKVADRQVHNHKTSFLQATLRYLQNLLGMSSTHDSHIDYQHDYVALPDDYGADSYYNRNDVQSIIKTVRENLTTLDRKTHFTDQITDRKVVIKPNLVTVCHNMGFVKPDYPNTTDPRVLDAVVLFLKDYTSNIVIAESSGRPIPTRASFKMAGVDRLARHHGIELMALEEQQVDRYFLPKAEAMKEVIVPQIFTEIVEGRAFYISMPKLKTNLYTKVTLGFKNSMGCLSYNLRQRNHNFNINQKLVDILYLFQPDLVIIDGIVGAEGQCPAPVDPVDSRVIISGDNPVETDRVATRMMGQNPDEVDLTRIATEKGFGDSSVEVIGKEETMAFRPADPSLMNDAFQALFPQVKILIGHRLPNSQIITDKDSVTPEMMRQMELDCRGGCLATTRLGFDYLYYEGVDRSFELVVVIGCGVEIDGGIWYFDRDGHPYSLKDIAGLPGKKLAVGSCARIAKDVTDDFLEGCMINPNAGHMAIHKLSGERCRIVSSKHNPSFSILAKGVLGMLRARIRQLRRGHYLDTDLNTICPCDGDIPDPTELGTADMNQDYIKWDFPEMTAAEKRRLVREEWKNTLESFIDL
ncbi:MAG: DUF362 domain-containing protein [Leptolyngbyaceae cyanobacterium MO_188.B28]|nr:DUF362 domain-containing protein [Leptolyngbyaceae cyanobacterium MO_188.B28]